jgi:hypothetical protein
VQKNVTGQVGDLTGNVNNLKTSLANLSDTTPKATFMKGTQIESPLASSYVIPTNNYQAPALDPLEFEQIQNVRTGGIIHKAEGGDFSDMSPKQLRGKTTRPADLMALYGAKLFNAGGAVPEGHNPKFFSEGGLSSIENRYVTGDGDGTSDSIPAMLANGEFVIPADVVSSLGSGSNDAGAEVLDELLKVIRSHKQNHDAKDLPPDSKGPLTYLKQAKQKVRA